MSASVPRAVPLPRTSDQMEWIRGRFTPDSLARIAVSTPDYYEQKGCYLPDVAALAYANGVERDALREALLDIRDYEEPWPQDPSDVYEHFQAVARAALAVLGER